MNRDESGDICGAVNRDIVVQINIQILTSKMKMKKNVFIF